MIPLVFSSIRAVHFGKNSGSYQPLRGVKSHDFNENTSGEARKLPLYDPLWQGMMKKSDCARRLRLLPAPTCFSSPLHSDLAPGSISNTCHTESLSASQHVWRTPAYGRKASRNSRLFHQNFAQPVFREGEHLQMVIGQHCCRHRIAKESLPCCP